MDIKVKQVFALPINMPLEVDNITFDRYEWFGSEYIVLGEAEATFTIPTPDAEEILQKQIESIDEAETKLKAEFQKKLTEIQAARNNLLAITEKK